MSTDGFVTTSEPTATIRAIESLGLEAQVAGHPLVRNPNRTGVELIAFDRSRVYFSGKD
jgi:hypothetical protein